MIGRTRRPDTGRCLSLAAAAICVFAAAAALLLAALPGPHTRLDYIMAGTVATLFTLVLVFVAAVVRKDRSVIPWSPENRPKP